MKRLLGIILAVAFCLTISYGFAAAGAGNVVDDAVITTKINGKIVEDSDLQYLKIDVDTKDGNVTLSGTVPSKEAEERLMKLAKDVEGVTTVTSNLKVEKKKK